MARLPMVGSDDDSWGTLLNQFLLVSHREDGTLRPTSGIFNVKDYGAIGDGNTDDTIAIQTAIHAAGDAGGGTVFVPPSRSFYRTTKYLLGRDNVAISGAGYGSFIKNDFRPQNPDNIYDPADPLSWYVNGTMFVLGGYESVAPWRVDDEFDPEHPEKHECGDEFAGEYKVTLNEAARVTNFAEGDIVFIRSTAEDAFMQLPHSVPFYTEINEVVSTDASGGISLKYPLQDDYRAMLIARSSSRESPAKFPIKVLKRFVVEKLRLETANTSGVFGFGGCLECNFQDLWLTTGDAFMLGAMAYCIFENLHIHYSRRLGELAFYSHNNLFRNIHAWYSYYSEVAPGNGWGIYEGAHNNTFDNIFLNHGKAGTRAWVVGAGRRNDLLHSEIISQQQTNGQAVVGLFSTGTDFKPKDCTIAYTKIKIGENSPVSVPFAIEIDSGGPYGGGNIIRGNIIEGECLVAPIGLRRIDKRNGLNSQYGCENNIIEDNIHTSTNVNGELGIPVVSMIVEYNNRWPNHTPTLIDPQPKFNLIRNNLSRHRQVTIADYVIGEYSSGTETIVRSYTIPRYSVGTHHRWLIQGAGRVEPDQIHDNKHVRLHIIGSLLFDIEFASSETGTWSFQVEIAGKHLSNENSTDTVIVKKMVYYSFWKNGLNTSGATEYLHNSNLDNFLVDLRALISNSVSSVQDRIFFDKFTITPFGDEYSYVNWDLLQQRWGVYPSLCYTEDDVKNRCIQT